MLYADYRIALATLSAEDQRRVREFIDFLNEHYLAHRKADSPDSRGSRGAHRCGRLIADLLAIAEDEGLADAGDLPAKLARWHAARQGRIEPSPSPVATSPASPLPLTSPDGAGASCGPLASPLACKGCGSPRSGEDTGYRGWRCDACGLVQAS